MSPSPSGTPASAGPPTLSPMGGRVLLVVLVFVTTTLGALLGMGLGRSIAGVTTGAGLRDIPAALTGFLIGAAVGAAIGGFSAQTARRSQYVARVTIASLLLGSLLPFPLVLFSVPLFFVFLAVGLAVLLVDVLLERRTGVV